MQKEIKIEIPEGHKIDVEKSTFERIVFKAIEKKLPESWKELGRVGGYYIDSESDICYINGLTDCIPVINAVPTRELAEAMLALCQLLQLRDVYNNGWIPNWLDSDPKYVIRMVRDEIYTVDNGRNLSTVLHFKTKELRDKFISCPEIYKLIQIAKPLL